jgi:carboxylesterase
VTSLLELIKLAKARLHKVSVPVLIIQSKVERTVKPESAEFIYHNLTGTQEKKLVWLYECGHVITLDNERETVFAEIEEFLQKYR